MSVPDPCHLKGAVWGIAGKFKVAGSVRGLIALAFARLK